MLVWITVLAGASIRFPPPDLMDQRVDVRIGERHDAIVRDLSAGLAVTPGRSPTYVGKPFPALHAQPGVLRYQRGSTQAAVNLAAIR
ncbi:hypothetical protein HS041_27230 [Planomonospora sp. ID67723]|uniref:hypothetical protein n=1 Tax=Planomonospora sp. ID67723 TaxID=2738134 RepID=UPI0018C3B707|nr:hypothetical protein [Planomonospora sp. ID67723]MBG0831444.1 hypothetical protein [Planomonospora sp. ID67723]